MRSLKLYNVIFPLYLVWLLPPILFIVLAGNFVIDALVIGGMATWLGVRKNVNIKYILQAWGLGFVADIVGVILLYGLEVLDLVNTYTMQNFTQVNLWEQGEKMIVMWTLFVLVFLFVGILIYLFNNYLAVKHGIPKEQAWKIALAMAVITAPWTWLLPLEWFLS